MADGLNKKPDLNPAPTSNPAPKVPNTSAAPKAPSFSAPKPEKAPAPKMNVVQNPVQKKIMDQGFAPKQGNIKRKFDISNDKGYLGEIEAADETEAERLANQRWPYNTDDDLLSVEEQKKEETKTEDDWGFDSNSQKDVNLYNYLTKSLGHDDMTARILVNNYKQGKDVAGLPRWKLDQIVEGTASKEHWPFNTSK